MSDKRGTKCSVGVGVNVGVTIISTCPLAVAVPSELIAIHRYSPASEYSVVASTREPFVKLLIRASVVSMIESFVPLECWGRYRVDDYTS